MFWATDHLAQASVPRLSEQAWEICVFLLESQPRRETFVLGEEWFRPSEKASPSESS